MSDVLFPFLLLSSHRHALALGVQNWYGIHTEPYCIMGDREIFVPAIRG